MSIGKIKKIPLREIWANEARDFTTWLEDNIECLNETLNLQLSVTEREKSIGPFSCDIVAEDHSGAVVAIENQLEKTDHDHLGKMVTYLSNLENARTAIWISSNPTEEHTKAIEWLNEFTPGDVCFYLLKVEAIKIEDSQPAPLFTIVAQPTELAKQIGQTKKELAGANSLRKEFWERLISASKEKTKLLANVSSNIYSWIGTGAGITGVSYNLSVASHSSQVEVYMDRGKEYPDINKQRFDKLFEFRSEIEEKFGAPLVWERLDGKRASRVCFKFDYGLQDQEAWPELQDKMINGLIKLKDSFDNYIKKLK